LTKKVTFNKDENRFHILTDLHFIDAQWSTVELSSMTMTINDLPQRSEIQSMADDNIVIEF